MFAAKESPTVAPAAHAIAQKPAEQVWLVAHAFPQAPQFLTSVWRLAQYGAPASPTQSVVDPQLGLHEPSTQ
jgi:hypothetical protein